MVPSCPTDVPPVAAGNAVEVNGGQTRSPSRYLRSLLVLCRVVMHRAAVSRFPADVDQAGQRTVLLTGATGYAGGRLLHRLVADPELRIRCLTRRPEGARRSRSYR